MPRPTWSEACWAAKRLAQACELLGIRPEPPPDLELADELVDVHLVELQLEPLGRGRLPYLEFDRTMRDWSELEDNVYHWDREHRCP